MRLLGLEWTIVPFSSKSMNHMAYLAHVATDVWCVHVCYCLSNSYAIVIRHNRRFNDHAATQFRDRQKPHPLFHATLYGDDIIGREWKPQKTARSGKHAKSCHYPYTYNPPHPPFNHRRCLQDDRLLNGRLSLGLSKFCLSVLWPRFYTS